MKNLLLILLTLTFTISSSAQYAILSAVDVKDGMEDQYLALEAFFGPIHDLAIEKGMRFAIREGGRTVGAGVVSKILE